MDGFFTALSRISSDSVLVGRAASELARMKGVENDGARTSIIAAGGIPLLMAALATARHANNAKVTHCVVSALTRCYFMFRSTASSRAIFTRALVAGGGVQLLPAALSLFPDDTAFAFNVSELMASLRQHSSEEQCIQFIAAGAIPGILAALYQYECDSSSVVEFISEALFYTCIGAPEATCAAIIAADRGIPTLMSVLRIRGRDSSISEHLIAILCRMLQSPSGSPDLQSAMVAMGGIPTLRRVLLSNRDVPPLGELASELLRRLQASITTQSTAAGAGHMVCDTCDSCDECTC